MVFVSVYAGIDGKVIEFSEVPCPHIVDAVDFTEQNNKKKKNNDIDHRAFGQVTGAMEDL